jgi:uncharacterized membrane protein YedE/YeeE
MDTPTTLFLFGWQHDLLGGAALFGAGWRKCGNCTKPAVTGLGTGSWALLSAPAGVALCALAQGLRARP